MRLALVANRNEWEVLHEACARAVPPRSYWYAAAVTHPVSDLLSDRCPWCTFKLSEQADPHLEIRTVA